MFITRHGCSKTELGCAEFVHRGDASNAIRESDAMRESDRRKGRMGNAASCSCRKLSLCVREMLSASERRHETAAPICSAQLCDQARMHRCGWVHMEGWTSERRLTRWSDGVPVCCCFRAPVSCPAPGCREHRQRRHRSPPPDLGPSKARSPAWTPQREDLAVATGISVASSNVCTHDDWHYMQLSARRTAARRSGAVQHRHIT